MKSKIMVIMIFFFLTPIFGQIKTAAYWTAPTMSLENARALSVHNLVIADLENMFNNRESLLELKRLNTNLKLLAYGNAQEIFEKTMANRPLQTEWTREIRGKYTRWLLKTAQGQPVVFYQGMQMLNMSSFCPKYEVPGLGLVNYQQWMADLLIKRVFSDPIWDGHFLDNGGENVSWVHPAIDANLDGRADQALTLDQAWSEGVREYLQTFRRVFGHKFILTANKGSVEFMDILDGRMFEWWPNDYLGDKRDGGWWQNLVNANQTGPYTIWQIHEKDVDFAITSALLMPNYQDIYIAVGHNSLRYPEVLKTDFGPAQGEPVIIRDFKNAQIEITPSQRKARIIKK